MFYLSATKQSITIHHLGLSKFDKKYTQYCFVNIFKRLLRSCLSIGRSLAMTQGTKHLAIQSQTPSPCPLHSSR